MLRKQALIGVAMGAAFLATHASQAKVSEQEAARLKTDLTPVGAERAGNKDGTIPPWTGGMTQVPANFSYKSGDPLPDFWANEKPLFTIDASNVGKYADKLDEGALYFLKNVKGFRLNVYPTHRTAAMPQWVYDNTLVNATRAVTTDEGNHVEGAYGGIPFPIPEDGKQAIWNMNLSWRAEALVQTIQQYIVSGDNPPILSSSFKGHRQWDYYNKSGSLQDYKNYFFYARNLYIGPANRAGEALLAYDTSNDAVAPYIVWQYLTGQRRLRKAPNVQYDGAYPDCSGTVVTDELIGFNGNTDRYQMKLLGKKEMFIPYNDNALYHSTATDLLKPHALNPDLVRWELHRVWAVDMTVVSGKRHIIPHRVVYLDEDTWQVPLADEYDAQGRFWKWNTEYPTTDPLLPAVAYSLNVIYDTQADSYCALNGGFYGDGGNPWIPEPRKPESFYQPETVASETAR